MNHELPECMLVWYNRYFKSADIIKHGEEICHQGWGDLKLDGINKKLARKVWNKI